MVLPVECYGRYTLTVACDVSIICHHASCLQSHFHKIQWSYSEAVMIDYLIGD